jgi:hypothetical protein
MTRNNINKVLAQHSENIIEKAMDAELKRVKANPEANRLTLIFENGTNYRYFRTERNKGGPEVRFCWTTKRNAAGYFLAFREIIYKKGTSERDQLVADKVKRRLIELSQRRASEFKLTGTVTPRPILVACSSESLGEWRGAHVTLHDLGRSGPRGQRFGL